MELQGIRRSVDCWPSCSIGCVQLLAKGARAQPELVAEIELRGVTATRVGHCKKEAVI